MRLNEIQVRAHPNAHQPRALEVEIVLDPYFGVEHAHDARDEQHDDEPRGDARGDCRCDESREVIEAASAGSVGHFR